MDRHVILSAVGFREEMVLPLVAALEPDEVHLLAGGHSKVAEALQAIETTLADGPVRVAHRSVEDWDFLAWSDAIEAALDDYEDDHVTVNLTAGHGMAQAMLGIHAAHRGLPVTCYDWETYARTGSRPKDLEKYVHEHSPAAVLHLRESRPIDRRILAALLVDPKGVTELVDDLGEPQSSVSTSLRRLLDKGFLAKSGGGRERIYSLRRGIEPMIERAVGRLPRPQR